VGQAVALDDNGEIAKLPPLDAIADTVGGEIAAKLLRRLRKGVFGSVWGDPPPAKGRDAVVRSIARTPSERLGELAQAMPRGELRLPIARRFPLAASGRGREARPRRGGPEGGSHAVSG